MEKTDKLIKLLNKYKDKHKCNPVCKVCDQEIKISNLWECEYIENRRGAAYFAHTVCIQHGGYRK